MKRRSIVTQKKEITNVINREERDFNIVPILQIFLKTKKYNVIIGDNKKIRKPRATTRNKTMQIVPNTAPRSNPIKKKKK